MRRKGEHEEIVFMVDGIALCFVLSLLTRKKIQRHSFDFSSIANTVFEAADRESASVFFVGGTDCEVETFAKFVAEKYKNITLSGYSNGFVTQAELREVAKRISHNRVDLVIVSMGAGAQEDFLRLLREYSYNGRAFTSGGFIRQVSTAGRFEYYPKFIKKLGLRAFYRMFREPHTISRYLFEYPKNLVKVLFFYISGRLDVEVLND
tara:strand:+ start:8686 stop:9306 length:621 start_codon:yes stop_codon:yes gene_type:complete